MKPRLAIALMVCMSPLFIYTSCKDNKSCKGVMCTMELRSITIRITDNSGKDVKLDEAYTVRVKTGEKIAHDVNTTIMGTYTVLDDGYQAKLQQSTAEFRFVGKRNGQEVVNELYMISADCCHISKQSGKGEVVVP